MSKVFGLTERYSLIDTSGNKTLVNYGIEPVDEINSTWHEVAFSKNHGELPNINDVKEAIIADIDADTDAKILSGYQYQIKHGVDEGKVVDVWLSRENQENFKAKHDAAKEYPALVKFPMKYKISEDENKKALYEEFQNLEELAEFYLGGVAYIESCLNEGWETKDNFDWKPYEELLPNPDLPVTE